MALKIKGGNPAATEMMDDERVSETIEQEAEVVSKAEVEETEAQAEVEETDTESTEDAEIAEDAKSEAETETIEHEAEVVSKAEVEEPKTSPVKDKQPTTAVQARASTGVAQSSSSPANAESYFAAMIKAMEDSGHAGMEMGYGVFPVVALDKGEFKVGDEDVGRDSFRVVPLLSRPKFAYRTTGVPDKDAEVVFADTDREHRDPNSAVSAKIAEWQDKFDKSGWEVKQYLDVFAYVVSFPGEPKLEKQVVQLSVAPTSIKRYTRAGITAMGNGYKPHECVYEVSVGEKIRGEFDYYPWDFSAVGSCRKFGVEVKFGTEVNEDF